MANRPTPSRGSSRPSSSGGAAPGGGRRRSPAAPIKKPFPWGIVAISTALGLLLVGILVYAVTNQGAGYADPLRTLDSSIKGLQVTNGLKRDHVSGPVKYALSPPDGGPHNPVWENCGVYTSPVPNEHVVHSMEHGAVWITYRPGLPQTQISKLVSYATPGSYVLVSPYPGLDAPISLQAWGRQLKVQSASDPRIQQFVKGFQQGPQTPELGSPCTGGTSATGTLQSSSAPQK